MLPFFFFGTTEHDGSANYSPQVFTVFEHKLLCVPIVFFLLALPLEKKINIGRQLSVLDR